MNIANSDFENILNNIGYSIAYFNTNHELLYSNYKFKNCIKSAFNCETKEGVHISEILKNSDINIEYALKTNPDNNIILEDTIDINEGLRLKVKYAKSFDDSKNLSGYILTIKDKTKDIDIEKELNLFKLAVEQSANAIVITNLNSEIIYGNKKIQDLTGYKIEELVGQNPRILNSGIQDNFFYEEMWSKLTSGESWQGVFGNKKKNGEIFWENAIITPVKDKRGKVFCYMAIKEDITKQRLAEQKLLETNRRLADREKNLEELNNTKDKLFSIIAHDLKNPFNSLLGFSKLLITKFDEMEKEGIMRMLKAINSSSDQGYKLLENLLEWSRTQTGKIKFIPEKLNLKDIVTPIISLNKSQASNKSIELISDIDENIILNTDANIISTVIRNLVSNAIKFTDKNGTITIKARDIDDKVKIDIIDTGVGIPEKYIDTLFNVGSSYKSYGTNRETGTGLGLILSKEFIKKSGGEIFVESEEGKGSTFSVVLPKNL